LQRLFRVTQEVVFCFDGDRAGRDAAWRALEQALPSIQGGRTIRFMFLPDGDDPDTLVRRVGKPAFEALIEQAQPLSEYFFNTLGGQVDLARPEGRAQLLELASPLLARLPEGGYQQMMLAHLKRLARQDSISLKKSAAPTPANRVQPRSQANQARPMPTLVQRAIELLLYDPSLATRADTTVLTGLDVSGINILVELLESLKIHPNLSTAAIVERWRDTDMGKHLAKLASWQPPHGNPDYSLASEFTGAINRLVAERHPEARMDFLLAKANLSPLSPSEKAELRQLLLSKQVPGPI